MNSSQTRVVDKRVTNVLWDIKEPVLVGIKLFPYVNIARADTRVVEFTDLDFELINSTRAPGALFKSIEIEYDYQTVSLIQDALAAKVPIERLEEAEAPSLNLQIIAASKVLRLLYRNLEMEHAGLATNSANYNVNNTITLAGTDQFNDYSNSDPATVIETAKEQIRRSIGIYPNVAVVSAKAFKALKHHPFYLEQFKYTSSKTITTEMLRDAWELQYIGIGAAIFKSGTGTVSDMWGQDIVLAYVNPYSFNKENVLPDIETDETEPSFGYTYRLLSNPLARPYRFDETDESWKANISFNRRAYIVGRDAGYLIKNAVS